MENTTNTTTPAQFIEQWLPDFETRYKASTATDNTHKVVSQNTAKAIFALPLFSEALETYRAHVWQQACEAMREVCADIVLDLENGGYCEARTTYGRVERAEIPEPPQNQQK